MDDAQMRARQFNADARIARLEGEVERLRAALRQIMDLDPDQNYDAFVSESTKIAVLALGPPSATTTRARTWQRTGLDELIAVIEREGFKEVPRNRIYAAFGLEGPKTAPTKRRKARR